MGDGGHGSQLDPSGTAFESAGFLLVFSLGWNFKLQFPGHCSSWGWLDGSMNEDLSLQTQQSCKQLGWVAYVSLLNMLQHSGALRTLDKAKQVTPRRQTRCTFPCMRFREWSDLETESKTALAGDGTRRTSRCCLCRLSILQEAEFSSSVLWICLAPVGQAPKRT